MLLLIAHGSRPCVEALLTTHDSTTAALLTVEIGSWPIIIDGSLELKLKASKLKLTHRPRWNLDSGTWNLKLKPHIPSAPTTYKTTEVIDGDKCDHNHGYAS